LNILGISAFYHDSAAAIINDTEIIAAVQEERFTRIKQDSAFPVNSIKFCLEYSGLSIDELDAVVFYDKPLLKFERLLETYYGFAPKGIKSFVRSMPVWVKQKMFIKKIIKDELLKIENYEPKKLTLLFPEHHLSHSASAYYPSPYTDAAILTLDGVGEWATASISYGKDNNIKILKELRFPHSLGLLYSSFTYYLGFTVNSGEYKLMGLAPYGIPWSEQVNSYLSIIKNNLIDINADGSLWLNQEYFDYATGLKMVNEPKWEKLFGFKRKLPEENIQQHHSNLALAIQIITEEVVLKMAQEAKNLTGSDNLCLAGGVALNCVANGKLLMQNIFKNIFIQPASGDAGGALGAAYTAYHIYFNKPKTIAVSDKMKGSYLGPEYSNLDTELMSKKHKAVYTKYDDFEILAKETAKLINMGNVIGWFQGRMEFGPRALGNRSIIADPRNPEMQKKLNLKIKYREGFRPFAPSVLAEDCAMYFNINNSSPYMLLIANIAEKRRIKLPDNYNTLELMEKLYIQRSDIPAITHIDFSARIQTVHKETNPRYYKLIQEFKTLTGYSLIINTSFNVRGEPIICSPEHAYKCFMRTEMDYLVINDFLYKKTDQPFWNDSSKWKEEFNYD